MMEACLCKVADSIVGKIIDSMVDPMVRNVGYLFNYRSKLQNLKDQLEELKFAKERMQQSVNEATWNNEEIFEDVNNWLSEVNGKISSTQTQLEVDENKAKQKCFVGILCPNNIKSRYQLAWKADKEANTIAQLLEKANKLGTDHHHHVGHPPAPQGIVIPHTQPVVKDYENEMIESRRGAFKEIMAALKDANLSIFGVLGMGGVGKTTLVNQVAEQAKEENLFDAVVMAALTQKYEIREIQDKLAKQLGLTFVEQSDTGIRAHQLRQRLMKNKGVLIILDDIWEALDLEAIGIPSPGAGAKYEGCKILMTSRELNVLSLMDSQKDIAIDVLEEGEAWDIFKKMAGDIVLSPDLNSTARQVARKCAGLPVAIVAVGKAMRNKKLWGEWKDALQKLNPSKRNFKGISGSTYAAIELSYSHLDDEEHRLTFLLCSIMGRDVAIEDLLKYGMGLGLFHGVNTIEQTRNRVVALVSSLKNSSLLLDDVSNKPDCFDMHDVVRDVAISIAARDFHWLALLGNDDLYKEDWSDEAMKNRQLISLHKFAKVSEVLIHDRELQCPNLTSFFLVGGGDEDTYSLKIPNNFFKGMQRLKVLGFVNMHFSSLPSSIVFLKSTLRTLNLSDCTVELEDIAIIGELTSLEILDLRRSKVKMLPIEIGQLSFLKLLNLSDCKDLQKISPNLLSRLSSLEELYLYGSFDRWEIDADEGCECDHKNARLVELQHLPHLTTLEVHIPNEQAIPKDNTFLGKLERYKISIGRDSKWHWYIDYYKLETSSSRMLKLNLMDQNINFHLYDGVQMLVKKADNLCLVGVKDVVVDMANDIQHLKHFKVSEVSEIRYVINLMKSGGFPVLESLSLENLVNLETIYYGQLQSGSFDHLRVIKVEDCNKLKYLFPFSVAIELHQLQEIVVRECKNMTELILEKGEQDNGEPLLSLLQPEIGIQEINAKPNAMPLAQKVLFPSLTTMGVYTCHNLKYLFPSSVVKNFLHLKKLVVKRCSEMEEIITVSEGSNSMDEERTSNSTLEFHKLQDLTLEDLGNLKRFCSGNNNLIKFPVLRELKIQWCPVLRTFGETRNSSISTKNLPIDNDDDVPLPQYLFNEKVALPKLERLSINGMASLERIWPNQLGDKESFSKLSQFSLGLCGKLRNIFPLDMLTRLQNLSDLWITYCNSLEEIVILEPQQQGLQPIEFPQVKDLELFNLPNLKSFSPKRHTIKWPSLERLRLSKCHKVEICFRETLDGRSQQDIPIIQRPLFWVNELTFPKLEHLTLGWNDGWHDGTKEIWHGHLQLLASNYFCRLKSIQLENFPRELDIFPGICFQFLISFPNLERLAIDVAYFEEIFQVQGDEKKPSDAWAPLLSRLTELELLHLYEMRSLWNDEKEGILLFHKLRILKFKECHQLKDYLVPSSISFQNLVLLEVTECYGIKKLITHQTAKSLFHLQEMRIVRCEKIEEIIIEGSGHEEEEEDGDMKVEMIPFPSLKLLELDDLPSLESFCLSANFNFQFPSLETVMVENCPNMKIFSQGESITPRLDKVTLALDERWSGSLNKTIQDIFMEVQQLPSLPFFNGSELAVGSRFLRYC